MVIQLDSMLGGRARVCAAALLDRDAPVDTFLLGRVVARGFVVRAAVIPDDDVAFAPLVAGLPPPPGHLTGSLPHPPLPPPLIQHPPAPELARGEVEGPSHPLRPGGDDL